MNDVTLNDTQIETINAILDAGIGHESDDCESVVVSYGDLGELHVTPYEDGEVSVQGRLNRRSGYHHAELRKALRAAGIIVRLS